MGEFFRQIQGWLSYGLLGLAVVMIIVAGYLVIKRPDKIKSIILFMGFCLAILVLFGFMHVGLVEENKHQKFTNDSLSKQDSSHIEKINLLTVKQNFTDSFLRTSVTLPVQKQNFDSLYKVLDFKSDSIQSAFMISNKHIDLKNQ